MSSLQELLRDADGSPVRPDHTRIARRGRRLVARRLAATVGAVAIAVSGLVGISFALLDGPGPRTPVVGDPPERDDEPDAVADETVDGETAPDGDDRPERPAAPGVEDPTDPSVEGTEDPPSQSADDAERDGIHAEIAALPFDERVNPDLAGVGRGEQRVARPEGVWVVSRVDPAAVSDDGGPLVGDRDGRYGRDLIDLNGYGEVLLLDHDEQAILRAFPFPDVAPQALLVTDEAVFCTRQGDGGLPDSMLCRIDRRSFDGVARIFPWDGSSHLADPEEYHLPDDWTIDDPVGEVLFEELEVTDGELVVEGNDGRRRVDPTTLELLDDDAPTVEATTDDEQLIADLLAFASSRNEASAAALPFAEEVGLGLGGRLHTTVPRDEIADPDAWILDVEEHRAYVGPFSALDVAADADDTVVSVGPHDHCVSAPQPPPSSVAGLRRLSVQPNPDSIDSCLQWWTVDLFVDDDGRVHAVTMDLFEP